MPSRTHLVPRRTSVLVCAALGAGALPALAVPAAAAAQPAPALRAPDASSHYLFTTLGDPADPTFNQLLGINDFGVIAGYFGSGSPATTHPNKGYRVAPYSNSQFVSENFPGSQQTQVTAINDWGNTVGFYVTASGANYGFLDENGVMTSVTDPATTSQPPVDQLLGVNNNGQAAGFYNDKKGNAHAFTWSRNTKAFTPVTPPGATSTTATAINDHGTVAGFFTAANGNTDSFIEHAGSWKVLSFPGSKTTQIFGMNDLGTAVGSYAVGKQTHGFVYSNGSFKTVDDPAGPTSTIINGLNNVGAIVGFYTDAKGNTDGFVAQVRAVGIPTA